MARNNEPALRRKTPLLICSIRTEIPYPWVGSSASVFRMSMSSVPWTRSLGLSGIEIVPPGHQEEHTLLLLVVKRKGERNPGDSVPEFEELTRSRFSGIIEHRSSWLPKGEPLLGRQALLQQKYRFASHRLWVLTRRPT